MFARDKKQLAKSLVDQVPSFLNYLVNRKCDA